MPRSSRIGVGIDLGPTYCCVSIYKDGNSEVVEFDHGERLFPSTFTIDGDKWHIGRHRLEDSRTGGTFVQATKRLLGRTSLDQELARDIENFGLPFQLDDDGRPVFRTGESFVYPEEFAALLFLRIAKRCEETLGTSLEDVPVVVTVPAYFTGQQRQAVGDAAKIAGFKITRLVNEPTAAAVAHLWKKGRDADGDYIIADLGGGTLDITGLNASTSKEGKNFLVWATAGDNALGGYDFDSVLTDEFQKVIQKKIDRTKLLRACEEARRQIKEFDTTVHISLQGQIYSLPVEQYNEACEKLWTRFRDTVDQVRLKAKKRQVDVIPVGGASHSPLFKAQILRVLGRKIKFLRPITGSEVVAKGACILAAVASIVLLEVLSRSLNIEYQNKSQGLSKLMDRIFEWNCPLPAARHEISYQSCEDVTTITLYEGDKESADENIWRESFTIQTPKGGSDAGEEILLSITVDADSTVYLQATVSSDFQERVVNTTTRFSDEEFSAMRSKAQERFYSTQTKRGLVSSAEMPSRKNLGKRHRRRPTDPWQPRKRRRVANKIPEEIPSEEMDEVMQEECETRPEANETVADEIVPNVGTTPEVEVAPEAMDTILELVDNGVRLEYESNRDVDAFGELGEEEFDV